MLYDTLTYNGSEKSFAAWGFSFDTTDELGNQKADVFTATIVGANIGAEGDTPTFPFEAPIVVQSGRTSSTGETNSFSGGTIMFSGKRVGNPARATGAYEGVTYKFQGPWYDLENTHFQQKFLGADSIEYLLPEIVLNTSTAVSAGQILISVGDQIQAILQWLLDQYTAQGFAAPYQYIGRALNAGAIDLNSTDDVYNYSVDESTTTIDYSLFSLFLPSYIAKPMMCSDAIVKCLQLSPRVSVSFDYSTSPPTFHAALVDTMMPATLALFDGVNHKSISIQARNDLLVRCVNILYRINNTVGGNSEVDYAPDKWGPNGSNSTLDPQTGPRVVNELIDLQGVNITYTTAHLNAQPILATADSGGTDQDSKRGWWGSDRGGGVSKLRTAKVRFQDSTGATTTIPDATISDPSTDPPTVLATADLIALGLCDSAGNLVLNRVVSGAVNSWMKRSDGQAVVSKKITITVPMTYIEYAVASTSFSPDLDYTGGQVNGYTSIYHHVTLVATNGYTATYTTQSSETPGEAYIIGAGGIAQYLYNHLNALQYEGDYAKVEVNFGAGVTLRNSINFSNGAEAWADMNAQPQSIRRHYGKKTTEIQIGGAKHLSSGQLSALLNMWRFRRTWYNPLLRTQNALGEGGNVDQPIDTGNANTTEGLKNKARTVIVHYITPPNPADPTDQGVVGSMIVNDPQLVTIAMNLN